METIHCFLMNIIGYLKNHWAKHGLVSTRFDIFSIPIPNINIKFYNLKCLKIYGKFALL